MSLHHIDVVISNCVPRQVGLASLALSLYYGARWCQSIFCNLSASRSIKICRFEGPARRTFPGGMRPVHMLVSSLLPDRPPGTAGSVCWCYVCLHQLLELGSGDLLDPHHSLAHVVVRVIINGPHSLRLAVSVPFCVGSCQFCFVRQRPVFDVCRGQRLLQAQKQPL